MLKFVLELPDSHPRSDLTVTRQTLTAESPLAARKLAAEYCGAEGPEVWRQAPLTLLSSPAELEEAITAARTRIEDLENRDYLGFAGINRLVAAKQILHSLRGLR